MKKTVEELKKAVVFKVANAAKNVEMLKKVPHRFYLDLAVIYAVLDEKIAFVINNDIASKMGLDEENLFNLAAKNTIRLFPPVVETMESILCELMECDMDECDLLDESPVPMFVISNDRRVYGASAILFEKTFHQLAKKLGADLYILPSSIHELIVVPAWPEKISQLQEMVCTVNRTELRENEQLSDNVYHYNRELRTITLVKSELVTHTEAVEICPYCSGENIFKDWDVEKQGYIAKCQHCGKAIFLCDECMHSDDNPTGRCDWREENGCNKCFRGAIHNGGEEHV